MFNKKILVFCPSFFCIILIVFFVLVFTTCDNGSTGNKNTISTNILSGKWEVKDVSSRFSSFEFTKDGKYIVIENLDHLSRSVTKNSETNYPFIYTSNYNINQLSKSVARNTQSNLSPIHAGKYSINDNIITLEGFGILNIISFTVEEFNFSFKIEKTNETYEYKVARMEDVIHTSSQTEALCRSWKTEKIEHYKESGREVDVPENTVKTMIESLTEATILHTKAGTYLVLYKDGNSGLAEWKWVDDEEKAFYYSWNNWQENYWQNCIVVIEELSSSYLKLSENLLVEDTISSCKFTTYLVSE
jgi:hypothetical protein